jgi:hypothetical protein
MNQTTIGQQFGCSQPDYPCRRFINTWVLLGKEGELCGEADARQSQMPPDNLGGILQKGSRRNQKVQDTHMKEIDLTNS